MNAIANTGDRHNKEVKKGDAMGLGETRPQKSQEMVNPYSVVICRACRMRMLIIK